MRECLASKTAPRNRQAPRGWCYVLSLLFPYNILRPVKAELNDPADGLIGDRPAEEPAKLAGVQRSAQLCRHPCFAFGTALGALDLMLGALDQVKHKRADGRTVAQPDGTEDVKGKAAQHQDKGKPAGDNVQDIGQYCFHSRCGAFC